MMAVKKENKAMLIITILAFIVGIIGFLWGFAKDVAKNENYDVISQTLNDCEKAKEILEMTIDSLKNATTQAIILKGESKSIINGRVLVTPDYGLSSPVKLEFAGADGISEKKDRNFSTLITYSYVRGGEQIYVKKDNSIWIVNILNIRPVTIETTKIE
jgi:nitrogen fixation-related uncharacterized protein